MSIVTCHRGRRLSARRAPIRMRGVEPEVACHAGEPYLLDESGPVAGEAEQPITAPVALSLSTDAMRVSRESTSRRAFRPSDWGP